MKVVLAIVLVAQRLDRRPSWLLLRRGLSAREDGLGLFVARIVVARTRRAGTGDASARLATGLQAAIDTDARHFGAHRRQADERLNKKADAVLHACRSKLGRAIGGWDGEEGGARWSEKRLPKPGAAWTLHQPHVDFVSSGSRTSVFLEPLFCEKFNVSYFFRFCERDGELAAVGQI